MSGNGGIVGRLDGKVAVVTGGGSGIGRATCLAMAREGALVAVVGRDRERVEETVAGLRAEASCSPGEDRLLGLALDVTREADMEEMAARVEERFGRIDILVASAGIGRASGSDGVFPVGTATLPLAEWEEVLAVNLTGVFLSNRAVLPAMMRQRGGTIINVSSWPAGRKGQPFAPAYSASKFGVAGFSEALDEEVRPHGIRVTAIFPGLTRTRMTAGTALAGRFGSPLEPECVAGMIVFMASLPEDTGIGAPVLRPLGARPRKAPVRPNDKGGKE